jgi:hypothetical protein
VADSDFGCVSASADDKARERIVRLDRSTDRERPCCENLATIRPGNGPHGAELRCAGCGRHRGWLPKQAVDFLASIADRFGDPDPIILRDQTIGDMVLKNMTTRTEARCSGTTVRMATSRLTIKDRSMSAAPSIGSTAGSGSPRPAKNSCRCRCGQKEKRRQRRRPHKISMMKSLFDHDEHVDQCA